MKFPLLSLSLFSLAAVSPLLMPSFTPSARAGCVAVDVGAQVSVDGNREGRQSNETSQNFGPNCENSAGANVTTTGTQVCVSGNCEQKRRSSQYVDGGRSTGNVNTPNIGIKVNPRVHVNSPAHRNR